MPVLVVSAVFAAVPQKAFSSDNVGASAGTASVSTSEAAESSTRMLLENYAAGLDTLYGNNYPAYLNRSEDGKFADRLYFDSTEIPAVDAAYRIEDFDKDGSEELLVISVNDDSTLKLTMYEVTEGEKVSAMDTFDAVVKQGDRDQYVYAAEQGNGYTRVFTYDKDGPCIGFDSLGFGMLATGRRRVMLTVKYDGIHFQLEGEPYYNGSSGGLSDKNDELARSVRAKIEAFGTYPILDRDVSRIYLDYPLDRYLPDVHEIMVTETTVTIDSDQRNEWFGKNPPEKIEAGSIHFFEKNRLYSTEIKERFSKEMLTHLEKNLSFSEETDHFGDVVWTSELTAFGPEGNLYQSGYFYVISSSEDIRDEYEYKHDKLQLTFWETEKGIYLISEMNEDEKAALLEEGILPEKSVLVYSESDQPDPLEPSAEGIHRSIEKYSGSIKAHEDIVTYKEYRIPGNNQDACDFLTIIWKKDKGLIGYESSSTPDGQDLIMVWDYYVKREDGGLMVD